MENRFWLISGVDVILPLFPPNEVDKRRVNFPVGAVLSQDGQTV